MFKIDDYKVLDTLGAGAFGTTYKAEKKGQYFAIKLIRENIIINSTKRIDREIRILRSIQNPYVVNYIDDGEFQDGFQKYRYIVMEYLKGQTLEHLLKKGKLTIEHSCLLMKNVFKALNVIHSSNVIHRDLKPANLMVLNENLEIKLLDFGISKIIDASTLTTTGQGMGTYAYMAPEQLKSAKDIDFRSDYYSAGVIFYEILSGEKPLKMENPLEAIRKILEEIPDPIINKVPALSLEIAELIDILLKKEPHERILGYEEIIHILNNSLHKKIKKIRSKHFSSGLAFLPMPINNDSSVILELAQSKNINGAIFTGPQLMFSDKNFRLLNSYGIRLFIDPFTQSLAYSAFTSKSTYKSLPYIISKMKKETPKDFQSVASIQERAKKVMDFQRIYNPAVYISPFHFLNSDSDDWINIDYNTYKQSKDYLRSIGIAKPLYYGISFDIEKFEDTASIHDLVNFITSALPDGYYLQIAGNFDSLNSNHYYAYAYLVSLLSKSKKEIIITRLNDFSLGLLGLGATTIATGLGQSDNFKENFLKREEQGGSKRRYYLDKLLGLFNSNVLQDIFSTKTGQSLTCNCNICNNSVNIDKLFQFHNAIKHHYIIKEKQISKYSSLEKKERIEYFCESIDIAVNYIKDINKEKSIKNLSHKHLELWKDIILEFSKSWTNRAVDI